MDEQSAKFEGWCILELMGHRRLGGFVREQEIAGHGFLRIDIPAEGEEIAATQFCAPASVYAITPVTEKMARAVAASNVPKPVQRWELPAAPVAKVCLNCGHDTPHDTPYVGQYGSQLIVCGWSRDGGEGFICDCIVRDIGTPSPRATEDDYGDSADEQII